MWALVSTFIDIALHRRGPEDLPASHFLLAVVLLGYCLAGILSVLTRSNLLHALGVVGLSAVMLLAFMVTALWSFGKSKRFLQTATAYAGVDTLLTLIGLPLLLQIPQDLEAQAPALPVWLYLVLVIWSLEVFSYILSRSLEVAYWIGAMMAVSYFVFSYSLNAFVFGPAT